MESRKRPSPTPNGGSAHKRPKSLRACLACRKQKCKCEYRLGYDHTCQRCRTLNLTCTFNNDDDTVALLSMDTRGDRSGSPDDSATAEMAARIETLESAVKSLLAAQGYEALDAYRPDFEDFGPSSPSPSQPAQSPDTVAASKTPYVCDDDILKIPIHKWSIPQAAFRDFIAKQSGPSTCKIDLSLNGLISLKLSDDLLHIFGRVYQPWLPFTVPLPPSSQILLLSIYVLAFRHLPVSARRTSLYQALLQRFYNCLTSCMFSFCSGVETIYALSIIYKWAPPPPPGTDINFRQSWVLLNVATRFAGSMEVDHAPDLLLQIKRNPTNFAQMSAEDVHSVVEKARLFYQISLEQNASLLGTTHPPLPFPEAQPALLFGPPDVSDDANCRDARLIYFYALLEIVTEGMEIPGPKAFAVGQGPGWLNALAQHAHKTLHKLDEWDADYTRVLANVPDSQTFYFRVLHWLYWGYRLMVLTRFVVACGHGDCTDLPTNTIGYLHESRMVHLSRWSALSGPAAEAVVRDVVVEEELLDALAVVPDCVFHTIMFAAAYFIKSQTWSLDYSVGELKYEEADAMIARLVDTLERAVLRHDHLPKKYVELISMLMRSWRERRRRLRRSAERWVAHRPERGADAQQDAGASSSGSSVGHMAPLDASAAAFSPDAGVDSAALDALAFPDGSSTLGFGTPDVSLDQLVDMFGYNFSQGFPTEYSEMHPVTGAPQPPQQPQPHQHHPDPQQQQQNFWV
ncbi:hypothetical protein DENSPDRAFT_853565 [Dentipellis sp. KUC8613]|nr:hypothetical protein DENSPDRAFT_853565 [Dentipellis sp. KUC8613]